MRKPITSASLLQMPTRINASPLDPIDPPPLAAGSPAVRRMEARSGAVIRQFAESGCPRIIARRYGVPVEPVNRIVARFVGECLRAGKLAA